MPESEAVSNNKETAVPLADSETKIGVGQFDKSDKDNGIDINNRKNGNDQNENLKNDVDTKPSYIDHGWAWMIVLGCSMMHLFIGGLSRSYGIIYIYLQERFNSNAAVTAWVGGVASSARMLGSPISSALVTRFSTRSVVMGGALMVSLGCILSAVTPSIEFMFISFGLITGFGSAFVYSPGIVLVGKYFDKYRPIAMGLSTAGSGFGVFSFPPIMQLIFSHYSFFGGMLVIGALELHNCVCAALYRAPGENVRKKTSEEKKLIPEETMPRQISVDNETVRRRGLVKGFAESTESLVMAYSPATMRRVRTTSEQSRVSSEQAIQKLCHANSDSNKRNDKQIITTNDKTKDQSNDDISSSKWNKVFHYLDFRLLKNGTFICYALSLAIISMAYISGQMLLPPYAQERGVEKSMTVWLLSIIGITDTIGRISSGFVFGIEGLRQHRRHLYSMFMALSSITQFLWAVSDSFVMFAIVSAVHGLVTSVIISQRAIICIDLMGLEILSSSFGLTVFAQGIAIFIGPAVAGFLKDVTGSFLYSFIFLGVSGFGAALLLSAEWLFISRKKTQKTDKDEDADCDVMQPLSEDKTLKV